MGDRIDYFERMLADKPTGLLALANEYGKTERYVATHEGERTMRQHAPQIRFRARLNEEALEITLV